MSKHGDVTDRNGGAVRAKYIGERGGSPHCWLVYGDDFDTAGAITFRLNSSGQEVFVAHRRGKEVGRRMSILDAVELVLDPSSIVTFRGGRN